MGAVREARSCQLPDHGTWHEWRSQVKHLTTRQPSLDMLEVAIVAFKHVLVSEGLLDESEVAATPVTTQPSETDMPVPAPAGD